MPSKVMVQALPASKATLASTANTSLSASAEPSSISEWAYEPPIEPTGCDWARAGAAKARAATAAEAKRTFFILFSFGLVEGLRERPRECRAAIRATGAGQGQGRLQNRHSGVCFRLRGFRATHRGAIAT